MVLCIIIRYKAAVLQTTEGSHCCLLLKWKSMVIILVTRSIHPHRYWLKLSAQCTNSYRYGQNTRIVYYIWRFFNVLDPSKFSEKFLTRICFACSSSGKSVVRSWLFCFNNTCKRKYRYLYITRYVFNVCSQWSLA